MAELEGCAHAAGKRFQELGEHGLIDLEVWRQLKQHGPSFGALQCFQRAEKAMQKFFSSSSA